MGHLLSHGPGQPPSILYGAGPGRHHPSGSAQPEYARPACEKSTGLTSAQPFRHTRRGVVTLRVSPACHFAAIASRENATTASQALGLDCFQRTLHASAPANRGPFQAANQPFHARCTATSGALASPRAFWIPARRKAGSIGHCLGQRATSGAKTNGDLQNA